MNLNFKRIISKGTFIPEIDGLRFIAIASVLLFHLNKFLLHKDTHVYETDYNFDIINTILSVGHLGVPLFFVISGFILARPFAQSYLNKGNPVNLKNYFIRRVTRLEPPYILVMTILFFGAVYVAHSISFTDAIKSYLASITYTHNFIYGKEYMPFLNAVAWSLEIEIQFYILMPLLAKLFLIKNEVNRRITTLGVAMFFLAFDFFETLPFISILNYLEYFLIGFLLADLYVVGKEQGKRIKFSTTISFSIFALFWFLELCETKVVFLNITKEIIQLISIFIFYYLVLFQKSIKQLANPVITNIGGMCYTIYLLHYPLISMVGNPLLNISFSTNSMFNSIIYFTILLFVVMVLSAIYFILIERPCMDKDWYKKLFRKKYEKSIQ